jgi:RNA recognition motif-containing protein
MANTLWIGNIAPDTTDEELIEFVKKYAADLECKGVERVEGDGSRPAAVLSFPDAEFGAMERVQMRLHGMHWKGRDLWVMVPRDQ